MKESMVTTQRTTTLFEMLRESNILEAAQLEELGRLPEAKHPDPRALGKVLVQRGLLTKQQVLQATADLHGMRVASLEDAKPHP